MDLQCSRRNDELSRAQHRRLRRRPVPGAAIPSNRSQSCVYLPTSIHSGLNLPFSACLWRRTRLLSAHYFNSGWGPGGSHCRHGGRCYEAGVARLRIRKDHSEHHFVSSEAKGSKPGSSHPLSTSMASRYCC